MELLDGLDEGLEIVESLEVPFCFSAYLDLGSLQTSLLTVFLARFSFLVLTLVKELESSSELMNTVWVPFLVLSGGSISMRLLEFPLDREGDLDLDFSFFTDLEGGGGLGLGEGLLGGLRSFLTLVFDLGTSGTLLRSITELSAS